jgi:hypothetical protein
VVGTLKVAEHLLVSQARGVGASCSAIIATTPSVLLFVVAALYLYALIPHPQRIQAAAPTLS